MDERHPRARGPRPGDRDADGRVYHPHGTGRGCAVGCLVVLVAVAVLIFVLIRHAVG
ncbi:hypothetical protein [Embleya sp. AB8]|uniref:hypothetical protein n=1 Tax=Embleya sp. AB8 TaxID=3156304 RepID=UPI003C71512B